MKDEYWEIYASEMSETTEIFDWLMIISKEHEVTVPGREQEMLDWCYEHLGDQGDKWNWAIGIAYMHHVPHEWLNNPMFNINDGDDYPDDIRPDDIIFVFYNQEDAVEFKLVWS